MEAVTLKYDMLGGIRGHTLNRQLVSRSGRGCTCRLPVAIAAS